MSRVAKSPIVLGEWRDDLKPTRILNPDEVPSKRLFLCECRCGGRVYRSYNALQSKLHSACDLCKGRRDVENRRENFGKLRR